MKSVVLFTVAASMIASAAVISNSEGGPRVYIAPANGFETYLTAGIMKKHVPVQIVAEREQADFVIQSAAESQKAGWGKILMTGSTRSDEEASIEFVNVKTGVVAFAYSYHMANSYFGKQSAAESCAKHLGEWLRKRAQ
jgi:hypothetical protein